MKTAYLVMIALLAFGGACVTAHAEETQPPKEATGADADAARQFIDGSWTVTMLPPEGSEEKPRTLTMVFSKRGGLNITFGDESEPEKGTWLVTAATSGGADYLLDENELDANTEDDVYLDIAFNGPDKAAGVLHDSKADETLRVSMARTGAQGPAEAAAAEAKPEPLTLSPQIPPGVADAVESVKAAGVPADAVLTAAAADLDRDGTDEALVKITQMTWCSGNMETCRIMILKRSSAGKWESLGYPYAKEVALLPGSTNGYRDLAFDGVAYVKGEFGGYQKKD